MGVRNFWGTNLGRLNFGPLQKFRFPTIMIFRHSWLSVKTDQIVLKRCMVVSADDFSSLAIFLEF